MELKHSTLLNRDLRQDTPAEVGVSSLKQAYAAMDRGDLDEAKRIAEYARLEWQVVHDMYVNWSWAFFTYIADTYGEAELEKAFRSILGSYYKSRYDKVMSSSVETQLQLTVEGLRGHLARCRHVVVEPLSPGGSNALERIGLYYVDHVQRRAGQLGDGNGCVSGCDRDVGAVGRKQYTAEHERSPRQ